MAKRKTFIPACGSLTWAWGFLVAASGISWWLGHAAHIGHEGVQVYRAGVLVTAFFKAWLIGFEFMELKHAPPWLRHCYSAWIVGVGTTLVFICWH